MDFLLNGDETGRTTILLAHGAGAAMDTLWMNALRRAGSPRLPRRPLRVQLHVSPSLWRL